MYNLSKGAKFLCDMDKMVCCCFAGHRPSRFHFKYDESAVLCSEIKTALYTLAKKLYDEMDVMRFWCGGALGVDIWAAEAVLKLKKQHQDIELYLALPFPGYYKFWMKSGIERIQKIIEQCDGCETVSPDVRPDAPAKYTVPAYKRRNYFMVDQCQYLIAVFDQDKSKPIRSGTLQTVNYAKKKKSQLFYIHPDTAEVTIG